MLGKFTKDEVFVILGNICCASAVLPKRGNQESHYKVMHVKYEIEFQVNTELGTRKIKGLKINLKQGKR